MVNTQTHPAKHAPNVRDLITLMARLAQILAQEADFLQEMKLSEVEKLQKEKILITNALELLRKQVDQIEGFFTGLDTAEQEDLRMVSQVLHSVMLENHRRLLVAKEVNYKVVQAIKEVVTETNRNGTYDTEGTPSIAARAMSVTLNKMI